MCSRVVAYDATDLVQLYNTTIPGLVEGAPVISGDYTFVVSNTIMSNNIIVAEFRIVRNTNGYVLFTETALDDVAYAPIGVSRSPTRGNYDRGGGNTNDMLVWGEKYYLNRGVEDADGVKWFNGKIHFFQLPTDFDPEANNTNLGSRSGNEIGKVTLSAPLLPSHGQGAILSFQAGQVRGWSKGHYFGKSPT